MVVGEPNINNIMGGIENTGSVRLHNHRKKLKQRFDIIKKLGQGTYGKVQLGINKETGQEVAIKTIKKSKIETEADLVRIRREIQIMSSVQHPNIIHIYEVFENREKMVLVMEYAAGGELYDYLSERKVLAEEEARRIFRQIATACYYCHKHKICHRDLKLENILLDEQGNAKIADFGLSNVFDDQRLLSTFCGSPLYASPEIVKGTPYQGPEVDCWSLGVLLYTLVYGAMPFDGSNFKRLVRQISQGDYFEPKKPSRASPLIRDMLTVNPRNRANIEKICSHWWVNEGYDDSCLDISEELANQTPVRLDLLLSLAPPAPQLESEKLVVTGETANEGMNAESALPTRSQSAGSLMDFNPAERRIKDMLTEDVKVSPKRKLEAAVSTDQINLSKDGVKRKEKIVKENTIADITLHAPIQENASLEDASMSEATPLNKSTTQTLSREMDVEQTEVYVDPSTQGAACTEIIEDAKKNEAKKPSKIKKTPSSAASNKILEGINEHPSLENAPNNIDKENLKNVANEKKTEEKLEEKQKQEQSKIPAKRKSIKKKVLTDKHENSGVKSEQAAVPTENKKQPGANEPQKPESKAETEEAPTKPVERRRSRIFETAEKFQNMISANENKSAPEKPKKLVIPGVSVGGYKKEFERKASLTTPSKNILLKKSSIDNEESVEAEKAEQSEVIKDETKLISSPDKAKAAVPTENKAPAEPERKSQVQNAVNIISSALDKDGTRKSKSRPCMTRKPPVPFGSSGRSASGSIPTVPSPQSPQTPSPQTPSKEAQVHGSTPAQVVEPVKEEIPEESKTSSAEITLKSATLPRRKTTKAEIKLDYPAPKPATMGFKTEMAHHVEVPPKLPTQRSEVTFPVATPPIGSFRSASVEPEGKTKQSPRERIIPISFERDSTSTEEKKEPVLSPPVKPPTTKSFQSQRSTASQRSNSLSRQSTQESDSETTTSGEPIRKSPREYIIPIAVEGGGYVTPRAGSLEPSDTASTTSTMTSKSKFGRNRKLNDREGSEDESPFAALHRHSSFGRDSDTEDPRRDMFRMHSLRSSRPRKAAIEHNDSFSSGEDDDDDGFEILTAENLFSTLLSRVRDLTQRLNVDGRPGFPTSRLLSSHFDHGANFWNLHNRTDPLSRYAPIGRTSNREQNVENSASSRSLGTPWRRSVSRDLASDIESVFNNSIQPPTHTATLPRGDLNTNRENLNLTDLDLKKLKLSDEDALALSYLTPGLSRRIQKQLLAQLAPSEARKLSRTLSMRTASENKPTSSEENKYDRAGSTLPRRYSVESSPTRYQSLISKNNVDSNILERARETSITPISDSGSVIEEPAPLSKFNKSFLPVKSPNRDYYSPLKEHTTKYSGLDYQKPNSDISINQPGRRLRSPNAFEHKSSHLLPKTDNCSLQSPDSSTSDSLSNRNDDHSYKNTSSISSNSNFSESSRLGKYLSPTTSKYCEATPRPYTPILNSDKSRSSDLRQRSPSARRTSRFLRPDFYDAPKDGNYYLREKKEREMETQKVLKEIRDKRKGRFRERSASRENYKVAHNNDDTDHDGIIESSSAKEIKSHEFTPTITYNRNIGGAESTDNLLRNVSDNIKNLESSVKVLHDYVNVSSENEPSYTGSRRIPEYVDQSTERKMPDYVNVSTNNEPIPVIKKERASRIARPKSYPTENQEHKELASFDAGKSKISKINKAEKGEKQSNRNKFLQTIEKKFEKLRSFSNSPTSVSSEETKAREEKKSMVEDTIKRLREQSLPRNMDHCITESGLLKRAVSVEDISNSDPKQLQASRKSVTKILNLFKKYEEKGPKKNEKGTKTKKGKEESKKTKEDAKKTTRSKNSQLDTEKTEKNDTKLIGAVPVISSNNLEKQSDINVRNSTKNTPKDAIDKQKTKEDLPLAAEENKLHDKKGERPRSLLLDRTKQFQPTYNGARSDSNISADKDLKLKGSKLPVTSFRRSLNLENTQLDPPKFYKNPNCKSGGAEGLPLSESKVADRSGLKLDLKVCHRNPEPTPSTSAQNTNPNFLVSIDDTSVVLSPCEDNASDSWSVCSDYHTQELTSPVSPCNHFYSADENESVSDRIRRKSFYTRFNEKKRPRKPSLSNYRDLDLYKDMNNRKLNYRPTDYSSLDRRSADPVPSRDRKLYYSTVAPEPLKSNGKGCARSNTTAFVNDGYVNVPNPYQTYNPRIAKRSSSVCDPDSEETSTLDDISAAGKNRMYSYNNHPSRYSNRPFSPNEQPPIETVPSSKKQSTVHSSVSPTHV